MTLTLLRNTGLLAFVALFYGFALSYWRGRIPPVCTGIILGIGGLITMLDPTEVVPGVFVDSRTTMVMLAAFFGGPVAGLVSAVIAGAYRLWLGGDGAIPGVTILLLSTGLGLVCRSILVTPGKPFRHTHVLVLTLVAPICSLGAFLLPIDIALKTLQESFVPLNVVRMLGIAFLGSVMLHEHRRVEAESEIQRLAYADELSGLNNRRSFYMHLDKAWERWLRYKDPFTIIVLDIDYFKTINDRYGHPTGDSVIRLLSTILNAECRAADVTARIGGEEFAVLMPNTDQRTGYVAAERIRRRIEDSTLLLDTGPLRFTASFGVSGSHQGFDSKFEILSSADQALYEAKRDGRNCVSLHAA
ncbi:GGDEF domain-containing protein [Acuticoccus sediminis]|nr:diguanylate cyclase [Acuticoccus sediminis]